MTAIPPPVIFLKSAQMAIDQNKYEEAAGHITNLMNTYPKVTPSIALVHRCNCYYHMKEYQKCIDDAKAVLNFPDQELKEEVVNGCKTYHSTVTRRLVEAYTALGKPELAKEYSNDYEAIQKNVKNEEESQKIRESGNELYKAGDIKGALEKYQEAFKLNPRSEIICGNICAAYLKIENIEEAEKWANKSLEIKPSWQKGHYRKGLIMMKKNEYLKSMESFNECLKLTPGDSEVRKMYNDVAKLCSVHGPSDKGYDKKIQEKLDEIQKKSWDVFTWYKDNIDSIRYFGKEKWDREVIRHLLNDSFLDAEYEAMQTKYPDFKRGMLPRGFIPKQINRIPYDIESMPTYVLPSEMLISLSYLYELIRVTYPEMEWELVFSMYFPPTPSQGFVRDPPVPIFGAIVEKEYNLIIDLFSFLEGETNGRRNFDDMIKIHIESEDRLKKVLTCDDPKKFLELVQLYNKNDKLKSTNNNTKKTNQKEKQSSIDKNLVGMIVSILAFFILVLYTILSNVLKKNIESGSMPEENPTATATPFGDEL